MRRSTSSPVAASRPFTLTAVSDEETGGKWGARYLLENHAEECLGDAVLNLSIAEHLYRSHPQADEGDLSRLRAWLVSSPPLAEAAAGLWALCRQPKIFVRESQRRARARGRGFAPVSSRGSSLMLAQRQRSSPSRRVSKCPRTRRLRCLDGPEEADPAA